MGIEFTGIGLAFLIFFVRIIDVAMGTFRVIVLVKGKKLLASMIGFVEVFIWFMVIREALSTEETSIWIAFAFAGGFAIGSYVGAFLSQKFISGTIGIQIVTNKETDLVNMLRESGYGVTVVDVKGKDEDNKCMLFIEINKKNYNHIYNLIKQHDPKAFIVASETKAAHNGYIMNTVGK